MANQTYPKQNQWAVPEIQPQQWHGPALPVTKYKGTYFLSKDTVDCIWSSLVTILGTRIGSAIMLPTFGSALPLCVFEPNDVFLSAQVNQYTVDAIRTWEPRVDILNVQTTVSDTTFEISITFVVKSQSPQPVQGLLTVARNQPFQILSQFYSQ